MLLGVTFKLMKQYKKSEQSTVKCQWGKWFELQLLKSHEKFNPNHKHGECLGSFPTAASGLLRERQGETVSWSKAKLNMNLDGAKTKGMPAQRMAWKWGLKDSRMDVTPGSQAWVSCCLKIKPFIKSWGARMAYNDWMPWLLCGAAALSTILLLGHQVLQMI